MGGLRWWLFKSRLRQIFSPTARRLEKEYGEAAGHIHQTALGVARDLVRRQRQASESAWNDLGFRFREEMIFSMDLQFLRGVFHETVCDGPNFPTNGYDRIKLLLISFLMKERGLSLDQARDHALGVEDLFNKADPLFDTIERCGRLAYNQGGERHYIEIVMALHQSGVNATAYEGKRSPDEG